MGVEEENEIFLKNCIEYLEMNSYLKKNIFKVTIKEESLNNFIKKMKNKEIINFEEINVHTITSFIKKYFE
jgi:hypothetical protein